VDGVTLGDLHVEFVLVYIAALGAAAAGADGLVLGRLASPEPPGLLGDADNVWLGDGAALVAAVLRQVAKGIFGMLPRSTARPWLKVLAR